MSAGAWLPPFLLTIAMTFLIGIGLREYYDAERKVDTFGTVRTFVLIGILGFVLERVSPAGGAAYVAGLLALALWLAVYYVDKLRQKKGPGIIGMLLGLLTFAIGPLSIQQPPWVVVLVAISVLFVLHSKGRIRRFTDRLESGEVLTVCKFLAIAAVVLPLMPADLSANHGWIARAFDWIPLTPRQLWWAVVITTSISYAGYVAHVYVFPSRGLQLTGFLGGIYSSTATVLVIARRSQTAVAGDAAAAVLFAITMMYVRLAALVAIFRPALLAQAAFPLAVMAAAGLGGALWQRPRATPANPADAAERGGSIRHPLELTAAVLFAAVFAVVAAATKFVLAAFPDHGLRWLSFLVGFSDITPFVVSVLQADLSINSRQVLEAIAIASASNNVLKAGIIWTTGSRPLARLAVPALLLFAAASFLYAAF
jgi:uncharacterized membrane protein (DUF4010 family)